MTPANATDAETAPALLDAQQGVGLEPPAVVGDMAYSAAELRERARERGTEICARVPPSPAAGGRFSKDAFTLDLEAKTATCPAGQTTGRRHQYSDGGGAFLFDGGLCADCELRERCTSKAPEKMRSTGVGRTISIHPREPLLQRARAEESSERFQQLIDRRPVVERKIAHLRRFGLRQARYIGRAKTRFQALATGLVANLARMARLEPARPELGNRRNTAWAAAA